MKKLFICLLLICSIVQQNKACKCMKKSLQETYCQSDIVMLAKITSRTSSQYSSLYLASFQANIRRIYRVNSENEHLWKKRDTITVYTPRTLSLCHAKVNRNTRYLLGGSIKRNKIYITSCSLLQKWNEIPKHIRRALRKNKLSCKCSITGCHSNKCIKMIGSPPLTNNCKYTATFVKRCYESNGVCYENKGKCEWTTASVENVDKCILSSAKYKLQQ